MYEMKIFSFLIAMICITMIVIENPVLSFAQEQINFGPGRTFYIADSPLKQSKLGVSISDITCNNGFYLTIKLYNREVVCLKAGTISKLASRGFLYGTSAGNANYTTIMISPGSENQASHNTYSPDVATVVLGINNTVRWINQADTTNTLAPDVSWVQNGKSFDSKGVIKPGQSYQFTFTKPGIFGYHGEPRPWQKGTVIVLP